MLIKVTYLVQYRRVFPLPSFQLMCNIFLGFIMAWALGGTMGAILNCQPIEMNWDPSASRDCEERISFWIAMGVLNILSDVAILVLPLPLLRTLPMPKMPRIVLIGVFCLGFL